MLTTKDSIGYAQNLVNFGAMDEALPCQALSSVDAGF